MRVWLPFLGGFLLVLAKILFLRGNWALVYHSMEFRHFSDTLISENIKS